MPDAGNSLSLLERDGQLLVRTRDDVLAETTGQLYWDFSHDPCVLVTFEKAAPTADDWFERGWSHEQDGRLHEAAHAYRQALLTGESNAQICFNLGNVLHALGRREAAIERYSQAVELDSRFAEAWNNLGNVLCELGRCDEATSAYERALHVKPSFPDPHYNLADLLLNSGRQERAGHYWRQYLQLESCGPWAEYARMQLAGAR
jgi:tetratricopeptide (TPR) repeat protein